MELNFRLILEAGGGSGFVFEGGDGFDEARHGEGVAHTALTTNKVQAATLASERNRKLNQRGNAGAVDLRNIVEIDDKLTRAALHQILRELVQMLAGFTDGEPSMNLQVMDAASFARRNFQWWMKRHNPPQSNVTAAKSESGGVPLPLHYTMKAMENKSMEARRHPWNVSTKEARYIQEQLRTRWEGKDRLGKIGTVAGLDASFVVTGSQALSKPVGRWERLREANRAIACVVVYRFPEMREIAREFAIVPLNFPYVPGLLSFREMPAFLAVLDKLEKLPDLLYCDGQGYAHPRRLGLAAHLGVLLDKPTIGCAKSILIGIHGPLAEKVGSWAELVDPKADGERIGAAVRTRNGVKPMYISQGNRISLESAVRLTMEVCDGFRMPRPTRDADRFASEIKRKLLRGELSEK